MGAMGDLDGAARRPSAATRTSMPFGAGDAAERVELLARENLEKSVLYPTIGLLWECELEDPGAVARLPARLQPLDRRLLPRLAAGASCRSRTSRCSIRRAPPTSSSAPSPTAARAASSRRSRTRGRRTATPTTTRSGRAPRRSACRSRSTRRFEPFWAAPVRFKRIGRAREFFYNVMLRQGVQQAFLSFIALGTLDRFPACGSACSSRARAGSARSSTAPTRSPRRGRAWPSG